MAGKIYLNLTSNGVHVRGQSNDPEHLAWIELLSFKDDVTTSREKGTAIATGVRAYKPIVVSKMVDSSSPLLAQALTRNEVVEGTFEFVDTQKCPKAYFRIAISGGRIDSIRRETERDEFFALKVIEWVSFVFKRITWEHLVESGKAADSWSR